MAKAVSLKIKLVSSADTGFYYVTKKNSRTQTEKMVKKKYDPVARKHVEFREAKIKLRIVGFCRGLPGRRMRRLFCFSELFWESRSDAHPLRWITRAHGRR